MNCKKSLEFNQYISAATEFAEKVLAQSKGCLLPDGICLKTGEPVKWNFEGGEKASISNLANQQNLLRTLAALAKITDTPKYYEFAKNIADYYFKHMQHQCGLLIWGGHRFLNLDNLQIAGIREKKGEIHELKNCFPYYELMFEANHKATVNFIHAFWNAHVYNWQTLEVNRHGYYIPKQSRLWASSFEPHKPFESASSLSFLNAGNDLIYSAISLFLHNHEKGALLWAKRLAAQYFKARHPKTGLGSYMFNKALKIADTDNDMLTDSRYGDRAARQFGAEFGEAALEGYVLFEQQSKTIYYHNAVMLLKLAKKLNAYGSDIIDEVQKGLLAYAEYAYLPQKNIFKPLLADGSDLSGYILPRNGYYGAKGEKIEAFSASPHYLYSYILAFSLTGSINLWNIARLIAIGNKLGDIGKSPADKPDLNFDTQNAETNALYSMLELYYTTQCECYLRLAAVIGTNIISAKLADGYFVQSQNDKYASFDCTEPLALLHLSAVLKHGNAGELPEYMTGEGYIHGNYEFSDGIVKPYTTVQLYKEKAD